MKISFITTVLNEESTIVSLIESLFEQTRLPDEIIIVDGGSTDATASVISNIKYQISNKRIKFKFIVKKSNRSVGRNEAIKNASNEIIICSDSGCILDKDWTKNITKPFVDSKVGPDSVGVDVVAGYYKGDAKTIFQKCLIPYVLVMPDKVDKNNFLPATRSMAFKKSIWEKVGGFPEEFSNNEDYVFAKRLKKIHANIKFEKNAIVYWKPRSNLKDAFIMFYRFAKGDAQSRIFRLKVVILFFRYVTVLILCLLFVLLRSDLILTTLYLILFLYIVWSIIKNYRYVKDVRALFLLPLIQITTDIAVIKGTILGLFKRTLK